MDAEYIKSHIRVVPNWPKPGIIFQDITPLLQNGQIFHALIDRYVHRYHHQDIDLIAGIDARGFILGAALAYRLKKGFIPIRKKGKLPFDTIQETYTLEYGLETVEMHTDACQPGDKVLLIDDLIATGGTMLAGRNLLERKGAILVEAAAIVNLIELGGARLLKENNVPLFTLYDINGT